MRGKVKRKMSQEETLKVAVEKATHRYNEQQQHWQQKQQQK